MGHDMYICAPRVTDKVTTCAAISGADPGFLNGVLARQICNMPKARSLLKNYLVCMHLPTGLLTALIK